MKALVIDINKCNGCYNCQIACKDEHVGNDWTPYAKPQPDTGQFRIDLHDARHTHASLMLKQGIHPKIVSERLGHASVAFTLDIYSHTVAGLQEAAAESFDKMLGENGADVANLLPSKGEIEREPPGARTLNLLIKSQLLSLLS